MGNRRNACVKHLTRLINKLKKHPITQIAIESIGVCAHLYVRLGQNVAAETSFVLQCQYAHELHGQLHVSTSDCFMTACAFYNQRAQDPKMKETERKKYRTLACQFAGKALLVRINVLGELDKRTASCHYNLGLLLRANGDLDSAYRELLFAREGRKNAFGENSLEVAEAEISLGITQQQRGPEFCEEALSWYHVCCKKRLKRLGASNKATQEVARLLRNLRTALSNDATVNVQADAHNNALITYDVLVRTIRQINLKISMENAGNQMSALNPFLRGELVDSASIQPVHAVELKARFPKNPQLVNQFAHRLAAEGGEHKQHDSTSVLKVIESILDQVSVQKTIHSSLEEKFLALGKDGITRTALRRTAFTEGPASLSKCEVLIQSIDQGSPLKVYEGTAAATLAWNVERAAVAAYKLNAMCIGKSMPPLVSATVLAGLLGIIYSDEFTVEHVQNIFEDDISAAAAFLDQLALDDEAVHEQHALSALGERIPPPSAADISAALFILRDLYPEDAVSAAVHAELIERAHTTVLSEKDLNAATGLSKIVLHDKFRPLLHRCRYWSGAGKPFSAQDHSKTGNIDAHLLSVAIKALNRRAEAVGDRPVVSSKEYQLLMGATIHGRDIRFSGVNQDTVEKIIHECMNWKHALGEIEYENENENVTGQGHGGGRSVRGGGGGGGTGTSEFKSGISNGRGTGGGSGGGMGGGFGSGAGGEMGLGAGNTGVGGFGNGGGGGQGLGLGTNGIGGYGAGMGGGRGGGMGGEYGSGGGGGMGLGSGNTGSGGFGNGSGGGQGMGQGANGIGGYGSGNGGGMGYGAGGGGGQGLGSGNIGVGGYGGGQGGGQGGAKGIGGNGTGGGMGYGAGGGGGQGLGSGNIGVGGYGGGQGGGQGRGSSPPINKSLMFHAETALKGAGVTNEQYINVMESIISGEISSLAELHLRSQSISPGLANSVVQTAKQFGLEGKLSEGGSGRGGGGSGGGQGRSSGGSSGSASGSQGGGGGGAGLSGSGSGSGSGSESGSESGRQSTFGNAIARVMSQRASLNLANIRNSMNVGGGGMGGGMDVGDVDTKQDSIQEGVSIAYLERRYPEYREAIRAIAEDAGFKVGPSGGSGGTGGGSESGLGMGSGGADGTGGGGRGGGVGGGTSTVSKRNSLMGKLEELQDLGDLKPDRIIPNPTGRRTKMVFFTADELYDQFKYKLLAFGLFSHMYKATRRKKFANMLLGVGVPITVAKNARRRRFAFKLLGATIVPHALAVKRGEAQAMGAEPAPVSAGGRGPRGGPRGGPRPGRGGRGRTGRAGSLAAGVDIVPKGPKLKQLRWDKVDEETAANSIWKGRKKRFSTVMREDDMFDDIEDMFGAKKKKEKKKGPKKPKKKEKRTLLEAEVLKNMGIAIGRLWKGDWEEFGDAVQQLDTKKITPEGVEKLASVLPTPKDMKMQLNDKGDRSNMDNADQFVYAMAKVNEDKRLKARVNSMMFQIEFHDILKPLDQSITILQNACNEVLTSNKFPELLGIILAVGNKLNQNQRQGDTSAIRLKDLQKLAITKSNMGETVLEYISKNLLRKRPELLQVSKEMKHVFLAAKINMDVATSDRKKIKQGLSTLEREFEKDETCGDDFFETSMGPFKDKAEIQFEVLEDKFDSTMETFKEVGEFLLETVLNPEDVSGCV